MSTTKTLDKNIAFRSTRLQVNHIPLRYRTGARFNPQVRVKFSILKSQIFFFQEKPEEEREVETEPDPDLIETAGVFSEESIVNVRKEVIC